MTAAPIHLEYELGRSPQQAFDAYVGRIGEWWHPDYSADPSTLETVVIEPRVGGRVYALHRDGREYDWGRVTGWATGRLVSHSFTLAQDPAHPSEVTVHFQPSEQGCRLVFEHGGWDEENSSVRDKFRDWPLILDRFAAMLRRDESG